MALGLHISLTFFFKSVMIFSKQRLINSWKNKMKSDQKQVTPLSPEQMDQWENDGYLLLKGVVPEAAINGVRDSFARVVDGIIRELKADGIIEDEGSELPFETRFTQIAGEHANRFGRSWRNQVATSEIFDLHHAGPPRRRNRSTHRNGCDWTSRFQCASETARSAINRRPVAPRQRLFRHSERKLPHPNCMDTIGAGR